MKKIKKLNEHQLFADKWHLIEDICPCDGDVVWFVDYEWVLHIGKFNEDVHAFALSDEQGICIEDVFQWKYPGNREIAKYPEDGQTVAFEIRDFNVPAIGMYSDRFNNEHGDRFKAVLLPYGEYDFEGEDGEIAIDWEEVICWYGAPEIERLRPIEDDSKIGDSVNIASNTGQMEADDTLSAAISAAPNTQCSREDLNSNTDYAPIDDVVTIDNYENSSENKCECSCNEESCECSCEVNGITSSILKYKQEESKRKQDKLLKEKETRLQSKKNKIRESIRIVHTTFYPKYSEYLINGNKDGLTEEEIKKCDKFKESVYKQTGCSKVTTPKEGFDCYSYGRPSIDGHIIESSSNEYLSDNLREYLFYGSIKEGKKSVNIDATDIRDFADKDIEIRSSYDLGKLFNKKKYNESYKSSYRRRTIGNMDSTLKTIEAKGYSKEEAQELNDKLWQNYNTDISNYGRGNIPSIQYRLDKIPDKSIETPMDVGD